MKRRVLIAVLLVSVLLAGCSSGGPSDKEAKETIYGTYFKDATIIEKSQCKLTSWMEDDGQTNVWLIRYKFKDSGTEGGMLLTERDEGWQSYMPMVDSCPE
jgi:uncharacterized protein YceK